MGRDELIITMAKEIFLKMYGYSIGETTMDQDLPKMDKVFKAITKTVTEAYLNSARTQ